MVVVWLSQRDGGCGLNDAIPIKFDDGEGNLLLGKMGKRGAKEAESEAEATHSALYPPIFDPDFLLLLLSSPLQNPLGDLTCVCVHIPPSLLFLFLLFVVVVFFFFFSFV